MNETTPVPVKILSLENEAVKESADGNARAINTNIAIRARFEDERITFDNGDDPKRGDENIVFGVNIMPRPVMLEKIFRRQPVIPMLIARVSALAVPKPASEEDMQEVRRQSMLHNFSVLADYVEVAKSSGFDLQRTLTMIEGDVAKYYDSIQFGGDYLPSLDQLRKYFSDESG